MRQGLERQGPACEAGKSAWLTWLPGSLVFNLEIDKTSAAYRGSASIAASKLEGRIWVTFLGDNVVLCKRHTDIQPLN